MEAITFGQLTTLPPLNRNYAFYLLETALQRSLTESDQRRFLHCYTAQDIVNTILESPVDDYLLKNSKWRLVQFYAAVLGEFKLAKPNQKGWDAFDSFLLNDDLKPGRIQVKGSEWSYTATKWTCHAERNMDFYDVLVFIGMMEDGNPTTGNLFVIPKSAVVAYYEKRTDKTSPIGITYNKYHPQRPDVLNSWWEYHVIDHNQLRDRVLQFIHLGSDGIVLDDGPQMRLF